jgi:hypothetical protein
MARPLEEIARLDRRWFRAHPERRHRCRLPDIVEVDLCDSDRGARLVITIRHLGRGHMIYQPVIFQGGLPGDERSAAALFALAATSSEPLPVVAQMDVLRLRHELRGLSHRRYGHGGQPQSFPMAEVADDRLEAGENGASVDLENRYGLAQGWECPRHGCGRPLARG